MDVRSVARPAPMAARGGVPRLGTDAVLPLPELVLDQVLAGFDVVLLDEDGGGTALLAPVAAVLARARSGVLQIDAASDDLGLTGLPRQAGGAPAHPTAPNGEVELLAAMGVLAAGDGGAHSRIVLVVAHAHHLRDTVLRRVRAACDAYPDLRLVLAGEHDLLDRLPGNAEFAPIRARLAAGSLLTIADEAAAPTGAAAPSHAARSGGCPATSVVVPFLPRWPSARAAPGAEPPPARTRRVLVAGTALGVAATATFAIHLARHDASRPPHQPATAALQSLAPAPAVPSIAAPPVVEASSQPAPVPQPGTGAQGPAATMLNGAGATARQAVGTQAPAADRTDGGVATADATPPPALASPPPPGAVAGSGIAARRPDVRSRAPHRSSQPRALPPYRSASAQRLRAASTSRFATTEARPRAEAGEAAFPPEYGWAPEQRPQPSYHAWWEVPMADPFAVRAPFGPYGLRPSR